MAADPQDPVGRDAVPVADLPVYVEEPEQRDRSRATRRRWTVARRAPITLVILWSTLLGAFLIASLVAARAGGPVAERAPTSGWLLTAAVVSGALVGAVGGWWAAEWPTRRLREQLDASTGRKVMWHRPLPWTRRAARAVGNYVAALLLLVATLAVGVVLGFAVGDLAPLISVVLGAGLLGYGDARALRRRAAVLAWEREHGAVVMQARVPRRRGSRATVEYDRTYPSNRAQVGGSRCFVSMPAPAALDGRDPFEQLGPGDQWTLLTSAGQWDEAAARMTRIYDPKIPRLAAIIAVALAEAGRTDEAVRWYERGIADGMAPPPPRVQRRLRRKLGVPRPG